ncbi:MAG: hypothetical protein ACM3ZV_07980 [Bacillota bacterium]
MTAGAAELPASLLNRFHLEVNHGLPSPFLRLDSAGAALCMMGRPLFLARAGATARGACIVGFRAAGEPRQHAESGRALHGAPASLSKARRLRASLSLDGRLELGQASASLVVERFSKLNDRKVEMGSDMRRGGGAVEELERCFHQAERVAHELVPAFSAARPHRPFPSSYNTAVLARKSPAAKGKFTASDAI